MTAGSSVSRDVRLLCMNAMCDNNLACAKTCMNHVTADVKAEDVAKWQQCTYSATCSNIQTYVQKAECADRRVQFNQITTADCSLSFFLTETRVDSLNHWLGCR